MAIRQSCSAGFVVRLEPLYFLLKPGKKSIKFIVVKRWELEADKTGEVTCKNLRISEDVLLHCSPTPNGVMLANGRGALGYTSSSHIFLITCAGKSCY